MSLKVHGQLNLLSEWTIIIWYQVTEAAEAADLVIHVDLLEVFQVIRIAIS